MKRESQYILFITVVLLVQIILLNNLSISTYIAPLAYIVCIIMMPLGSSSLKMIFAAVALGAIMDFSMGVEGLNVIATLPVAYFRRPILHFVASFSDVDSDGEVPTSRKIGHFHYYVVAMVLIHSAIFFAFEHMTTAHIGVILLRFLLSNIITLAIVYFFIAIFTPKLTAR